MVTANALTASIPQPQSMVEFALTTTWSIPAPQGLVWLCLVDTEKWPQWWENVVTVREIAAGTPTGIGNTREYLWHTCLPYKLFITLRVIDVMPNRYLSVAVSGDLKGMGSCDISWNPANESTQIIFNWHVSSCKPWICRTTKVLKPICTWNHNQVMKNGEQGLIRYLSSLQHPL